MRCASSRLYGTRLNKQSRKSSCRVHINPQLTVSRHTLPAQAEALRGKRDILVNYVFVVNTHRKPLEPIHPAQARQWLRGGRAAVLRRYPFTIVLKHAEEETSPPPLRLKLDPGSKTTGLAIVHDTTGQVMFAAEIQHRGATIKKALDSRRAIRRFRRQRHTRYRQARFLNRKKRERWLPPSLESRIANVLTWVRRCMRFCPITALSQELVKFDTQLIDNPEIAGVGYQQGTLAGYEVREYLLEKWNRTCAYCGKKDVPLQVEHIHPRANGGTNRVSNLTLACEVCNIAKGTQDIKVFLAKRADVLKRILAQAKAPLKDAAAVNATRWALYERLKQFNLPLETGTGGRTKWNRTSRNLPKAHWLDAANVGASTPTSLHVKGIQPLLIKATGHGTRQMCQTRERGFPRQYRQRRKRYFGFQTGDMVHAIIPRGKHAGTYTTRITVRASGSFKFRIAQEEISCSYKYCSILHRADGYQYS